MNWFKKLFKTKKLTEETPEIHSITCGERGEDGFAHVYINGEKTNTRMPLFAKERIDRLQKIGEDIHNKLIQNGNFND